MSARLTRRVVRGGLALVAFGVAAQQLMTSGFTAVTVMLGGAGILLAYQAASDKG